MSFTPNFTATQVPGSPSEIVFADTSTGSDGAITQRRIYVQGADGDYLVEEGTVTQYEVWALPLATNITLDLLTTDIGARVVVQWLDVSNAVLYDKTIYMGFKCFNEDFDYEQTQNVASNPQLFGDNGFWSNKSKLRSYIDSGDKAIERNSDIVAAQECYDLASEMRINRQYYFNESA